MSGMGRESRCVLFDWGDTLMRDFPEFSGPMASWSHVEALPNVKEVLERTSATVDTRPCYKFY